MNRKQFLAAATAAGAAVPALGRAAGKHPVHTSCIIPPYLAAGDVIGITSPAGYITLPEVQPAIQQMESWGFTIKTGNTIGKRDYTFGGTDAERAADLQGMLDDDSIRAIMCARGGYGMVRIIDKLDFTRLLRHPKWIIGFSDITVLHAHLAANCQLASLHSKMCNSFPDNWALAEPQQADAINSIRQALTGSRMQYSVPSNPANKPGIAEGRLLGGNLKTLESLACSRSDMPVAGCILFVEDTGEYMYSIDRMFWGLQRTGKLAALAGLVVGGFKVKPDDSPDEAFGKTLEDIVLEKCTGYNYPVCFDFPVGHQKSNYALKCGVHHRLEISTGAVSLKEMPEQLSPVYKNK